MKLLLSAFLFLLLTPVAFAQIQLPPAYASFTIPSIIIGGGPGGISITTTDAQTGAPISGALISVSGPSTSSCTTDSFGQCTISNLNPGSYSVTVSATNYNSQTLSGVNVLSGQITPINFALTPIAISGIGLSANPSSITTAQSSSITAVLSDKKSGVTVSFSTTLGNTPSGCTTDTTGSCTTTFTSSVTGTAVITASASGYTSGSISVVVTTPGGGGGGGGGGNGFYPIGSLFIFGTKDYLNVIWNATYSNGATGKISAQCYLNCPGPINDISQCISPNIQSCSYTGPIGIGSCTIFNPAYNYKTLNSMICNFQDPDLPSIVYKPYPSGTFPAITFFLQLPTSITFPIGEYVRYPVNIFNLGVLPDTYQVNITSTNPSLFSSTNNPSSTSQVLYGELVSTFPNFQFLSSSVPYTLTFQISSTSDISTCNVASDCSSLAYGNNPACVQGRCAYQLQLPVKATFASLPDFDWTGVVQILFLSVVIFILMSRKIKVFK